MSEERIRRVQSVLFCFCGYQVETLFAWEWTKPTGLKEMEFMLVPLGTINVIILTNAKLTDAAMARAIITVTEAKTAALQDLKIKSSLNS